MYDASIDRLVFQRQDLRDFNESIISNDEHFYWFFKFLGIQDVVHVDDTFLFALVFGLGYFSEHISKSSVRGASLSINNFRKRSL